MEIKGDWYLSYVEFDNMENRSPEVVDQFRLLAENAEEAYEEASELWGFRMIRGTYKGYDGRTYPSSPKVMQVLEMDPETFDIRNAQNHPFRWSEDFCIDDVELRNGIVSAFKYEGSRPKLQRVESFIDNLGMQIVERMDDTKIVVQKDLGPEDFSDWRLKINFTFRDDSLLKNIFVHPIEYLIPVR